MGKSKAEIQKAYRQRLKEKNNAEYLKRERERMRANYVPSSQLSESDRKKRNDRLRRNLRQFYNRKKQERLANQVNQQETSGYETEQGSAPQERGRMRVKLRFDQGRRKGALLRWKREVSSAQSRIRQLEQERVGLKTKLRSAQRKLQREKNKQKESPADTTPRKETAKMMNEAKLNSLQKEKLKKPLLLGQVLLREVRETKKATPVGQLKALHRAVSGKIVKKYKCASLLGKKTGLGRHRLARSESKFHQVIKPSRINVVKRYQHVVETFMKREDNSRVQPGKGDAKRIQKGEKIQTYVLTDYLSNLYQKFVSENPTIKLSFTSFCRSRPKYILLASFSSRSACLCTKHQNAALTVKAIRRECPGMNIGANPETFVKTMPGIEDIKDNLGDSVNLSQWKRVEIEERGKKMYITKIVESTLPKENFISHVESQMKDFEDHISRVKNQYEQIKKLKENLPIHEMIVQLDFAENYSCKSLQEVQSAYFNQTCVTLHPMVVYFMSSDNQLEHRSFIVVSDEMAHKASTVLTFIDDLIPELKALDDGLKVIHFWSDSPTSQYRNKHIFELIANHEQMYGIKARWNYFEAGHGKGPCDGLGGTCKRLADEAMRTGKTVIQDSEAFYEWALSSSMNNVKFRYVSAKQCAEKEKNLERITIKPIKGTMKIHAVVGEGTNKIKVRDISCYCDLCLSGSACDSWRSETIITGVMDSGEVRSRAQVDTDTTSNDAETKEIVSEKKNVFEVNEFVAAIYDDQWYVGLITDKDEEESEIEVNFMEQKKGLFLWPRQKDEIWISERSVLCRISNPEPTGKSQRMYKLSNVEKQKVEKLFAESRM